MKLYVTKQQLRKLAKCGQLKKTCKLRINLRKKGNQFFQNLTPKQIFLIQAAIRLKKVFFNLELTTQQTGGILPFIIPGLIAAGKALGIGAAGFLGSKIMPKISGQGRKKKRKGVGKKKGKVSSYQGVENARVK